MFFFLQMDEHIEAVGSFGRFQYTAIVIIGLISALSSSLIYATVFIAAEPDLICYKLNHLLNSNNNSISLLASLNSSQPNSSIVRTKIQTDDNCDAWSTIMQNANKREKFNAIRKGKDYECHFDKTFYDTTIITEWNLVCKRQYKAGLTQTFQIFGSIFGFFGGWFKS